MFKQVCRGINVVLCAAVFTLLLMQDEIPLMVLKSIAYWGWAMGFFGWGHSLLMGMQEDEK